MGNNRQSDNPTVYTTEKGRICPNCGLAIAECKCKASKALQPGSGKVRVSVEKQGRGGKIVTMIGGLSFSEEVLKSIVGDLKKLCGAGGSIKNNVVEIQGDHADQVLEYLRSKHINAKRSGG